MIEGAVRSDKNLTLTVILNPDPHPHPDLN